MLNQNQKGQSFVIRVLLNLIKILRSTFTVFIISNGQWTKGCCREDPTAAASSCRSGANTASNCWTGVTSSFKISPAFQAFEFCHRDCDRHKSIPAKLGSLKVIFRWERGCDRTLSVVVNHPIETSPQPTSAQSKASCDWKEKTIGFGRFSRSFKVAGRWCKLLWTCFNFFTHKVGKGSTEEPEVKQWRAVDGGKRKGEVVQLSTVSHQHSKADKKHIHLISGRWQARTRLFQTLSSNSKTILPIASEKPFSTKLLTALFSSTCQ